MDARAPAVVAVLVTRDPGPWFDETLAALAGQDYSELSVLVLVSGGEEDPTERVARHLPHAFVRRLPEDRGFGAAVNEAMAMVEGAAFFLLCHDDCAPDPDAVHRLVEESFRSNAGVVSPKMVRWDDPSVLLHVGLNADKTGAVVGRVRPGEVDHGQHDAARDVFVAPGGCTLVRADLLQAIGGYDAGIRAMGEDLDLSWRAQLAGARVVVAPEARARHLQAVAGGLRPVAPSAGDPAPPTLQQLQRRNELRTVLKCYSGLHLVRVLPQLAVLAAAEVLAALVARDRARANAVLGAWRWNLRRTRELRSLRAAVRRQRVLPDSVVRRQQLRGSARLATYASRLLYQGFDVAHGLVPARQERAVPGEPVVGDGTEPVLTGSVGLAFSEDADFDDLDDLGRRSGRDRFGRRLPRRILASRRSRLLAATVAGLVVLFGSRGLLGGPLPVIGQFAPLQGWASTWHQLFAGWQPAGLGTTAPATPAYGIVGLVGTLALGGMGLAHKVLVLGCIPVGAWGMSRLMRRLAPPRARLAAALAYLLLPLAYDALATGRWDGLVAYAVMPFVLGSLVDAVRAGGRASASAAADRAVPVERMAVPVEGVAAAAAEGAGPAADGTGQRRATLRRVALLGLVEAVGVAFAPGVAVAVLLCGLGITAGSFARAGGRRCLRPLAEAVAGTVVAAVLCGPWVVGTALAGSQAVGVFGLPAAASTTPALGGLLRFAVGPIGDSPLSWLLPAAALLPLLVAREARLAWAGRFTAVAMMAWALALVTSRGWAGSFAPSLDVLLAPAAASLAACVGLGVAAFELDLAGFRFGWRQGASLLAAGSLGLGMLPVLAWSFDGRWGLSSTGYEGPLAFMGPSPGGYRVLWLGDPRTLPLGGWADGRGVAYGTSEGGLPTAAEVWAPAGSGPASRLADAVALALRGETAHLGRLLAPAAVRYIVVTSGIAPGSTSSEPAPPALLAALTGQGDLRAVPGVQGFSVFENTEALPERAVRRGPPLGAEATARSRQPAPAGAASSGSGGGWRPVLAGPPGGSVYAGPLPGGTVFASFAPAGRWHLTVDGRTQHEAPAFGWAAQFPRAARGAGRLSVSTSALVPLAASAEVAAWLGLAGWLLAGRRRRRDRGGGRADWPSAALVDAGGAQASAPAAGERGGADTTPAAAPADAGTAPAAASAPVAGMPARRERVPQAARSRGAAQDRQ